MKILKLSLFLVSVLLLSGCGEKYLTCNQVLSDTEDIKINKTLKLGYKRTKLISSEMYIDYTFKKGNSSDIASLKQTLNENCASYKNIAGVKCFISNIENGVHFELSLQVDDIPKEETEHFEEMINYGDYSSAENKLRNEYVCG